MIPKRKVNHPAVRVLDAETIIWVNNPSVSPIPKASLCSMALPQMLCRAERNGSISIASHLTMNSALQKLSETTFRKICFVLFFFSKTDSLTCVWSPPHSLCKTVNLKCLSLVKHSWQREEPPSCIRNREFKGTRSIVVV